MNAACGDVMALLEAAFFYRNRTKRLLNHMAVLHDAIRSMLDRMGIGYEIEVAPIRSPEIHQEEEEHRSEPESPEDRVEAFVSGISKMLHIDTAQIDDPLERLTVVEKTLKKVLGPGGRPASRVELPPPVAHRLSSGRKSQPRGTIVTSLWQERGKKKPKTRQSLAAQAAEPLAPVSTPAASPRDPIEDIAFPELDSIEAEAGGESAQIEVETCPAEQAPTEEAPEEGAPQEEAAAEEAPEEGAPTLETEPANAGPPLELGEAEPPAFTDR
jgi:small subunit ribosomal protein S16